MSEHKNIRGTRKKTIYLLALLNIVLWIIYGLITGNQKSAFINSIWISAIILFVGLIDRGKNETKTHN